MADVVNEPFHAVPSYSKGLGGNGQTGWDWVIKAFELARKYMPANCKLLLNEYNVLHDNTVTTNYLNLIKLLSDRKLIDGIGIQGHYFEFRSHIDATSGTYVWSVNTIKSNLDRLAATGLPIYITEFDIDEQVDANQLASYKIYFPIFWNHPAVKGITLWGYINTDVWTSHPYTYLIIENGQVERPALTWLRDYILNPTDIKIDNGNLPTEFSLKQNYPNPFNPNTVISYKLEVNSFVTLKVYDPLGREVAMLVNEYKPAGIYNYQLLTENYQLPSGVYFYTLRTGNYSETKKMVLMK
jgi:endo-1,4-beta-xylanase